MEELIRRVLGLEAAVRALATREGPIYAKGTWTPTYSGLTTAGTTTYTGQRYGEYVRVGRLITFTGIVGWTAASGTGGVVIGGLPFTSASTTNDFWAVSVRANGVTFSGSGIQAYISTGTSTIILETPTTNTTPTAVAVEAAGSLILSGFYYV